MSNVSLLKIWRPCAGAQPVPGQGWPLTLFPGPVKNMCPMLSLNLNPYFFMWFDAKYLDSVILNWTKSTNFKKN